MSAPATDNPGSGEQAVTSVLDDLKSATYGQQTSIGNMLDAFGQGAYGPLLFVIGLLALSPIGAIPGVSILSGTLIVLLGVQMLFRDGAPWAPETLRRLKVDSNRAQRSIDWAEPYVKKAGAVTRPRYTTLLSRPGLYGVVAALVVLAATMYPLALIPWGVIPAAAGVTVLGLGLLARDGIMVAIGEAFAAVSAGVCVYFFAL
jgi:hypothetical protein